MILSDQVVIDLSSTPLRSSEKRMFVKSRPSIMLLFSSLAVMTTRSSFAFVIQKSHKNQGFRSHVGSMRWLSSTKTSQVTTAGQKKKKLSNTGGLRRLPVVKSPKELMDKARKVPLRVKNDT